MFPYQASKNIKKTIIFMKSKIKFGKSLLSLFMFEPGFIPINSGSFGSCPRSVLKRKRQYQDLMYQNQERWQRGFSEETLKTVRKRTSKIVKAPFQNIFVVQNSSTGGNAFLKSITWKEGDTILASNITYKSIEKTLDYLKLKYNIKVLKVNMNQQTFQTKESVLNAYKEVVENTKQKIRLVLLDHTSSTPMIVFPIQELTHYFQQKSIPCFVDGAHAFGQTNIDIAKLKPAGYIANYHKWGFAPTSSAFLYISPEYIDKIYPSITANYHGMSKDREFFWQGTRDISAFCAIPEAIDFLEEMKMNGMDQYCSEKCQKVTNYLCSLFQTEPFSKNPIFSKYMNNIALPVHLQHSELLKISNYMLAKYNFFPVFFNFDGKSYWRISIQVYSEMEDFVFAAGKLKTVFDGLIRNNQVEFNNNQREH